MKVTVERLQVRWSGRVPGVDGAPAGRLWLSRLLAGADLHPYDLPPTALLLVARMEDPLPGRIARSPHDARPTAEWEQAVRSRLTDLWHRAVRPVAGAVVLAGAEAVRFIDQAELLAALAVAAVSGGPAAWWRGVVAEPPSRSTLLSMLGREPRLLPAVLAYLHGWSQAEAVVGVLAPREALWLARAVAEAYEFRLEEALRPAASGPVGQPEERMIAAVSDQVAGGAAPRGGAVLPPWAPLLARRAMALPRAGPPEHRLLMGLLLALAVDAAAVRSARFLEELRRWWLAAAAGGEDVATRPTGGVRESAFALDPSVRSAPDHTQDPARTLDPAPALGPVNGLDPAAGSAPARNPAPAPALGPARNPDPATGLDLVANQAQATAPIPEDPQPSPWPEPIPTRLGGLLYLVNLLLRLHLLAEDVNPWERLEGLGRELAPAAMEEDPIWAVLASLAGRDPLDPPCALPDGMAQQGRTWLRAALPGVDEPERHLLLVDGQLYVTATHLDLVMELDRIRLEVRLAGLDADPGWAPDFGRVIRFHFV